jgi:hypothetical protein
MQELLPSNEPQITELAPPDWDLRQGSVRRDEWNLYRKGLKVVEGALDRLIENPPHVVTLPQVARLLEVVNKMGRIASGLGYDSIEHRVPEDAAFMLEVDTILERVFTKPAQEVPTARSEDPVPSVTSVVNPV